MEGVSSGRRPGGSIGIQTMRYRGGNRRTDATLGQGFSNALGSDGLDIREGIYLI